MRLQQIKKLDHNIFLELFDCYNKYQNKNTLKNLIDNREFSESKILITGGSGLVGSALTNLLKENNCINVFSLSSKDCNLINLDEVKNTMMKLKPDYVFHLAARVHGLGGNSKYKSDILFENTLINSHLIEEARKNNVKKIVAMGSGCVYPELNNEELYEEDIFKGPPHSSEDSYAHAKRLMLAHLDAAKHQYGMASAFVVSGNLYGPGDSFNINDGHVIPSLISKFYNARINSKSVNVWGTGVAIRDFTHSYDMANALLKIMLNYEGAINAGSGFRHKIKDIVDCLSEYTGVKVEWDQNKPDGQLVRYYNLDKLFSIGFTPKITLEKGIISTFKWYEDNVNSSLIRN